MKKDKKVIFLIVTLIVLLIIFVIELVSFGILKANSGNYLEESNEIDKDNIDDVIYFYADGEELLWYDSFYSLNTKEEYDKKYQYLGKYDCEYDKCRVHYGSSFYFPSGDSTYFIKNKHVFIYEYNGELSTINTNSKIVVYNFIDKQIENTYDYIYADHVSAFDYTDDYRVLVAKKNDKFAIINNIGEEISSYYDDVLYLERLTLGQRRRINYAYKNSFIGVYKDNDKYGILSFKNGQKVTEAIYDDISIFQNNIVVTKDNLDYVANESGNIISKGYNKIIGSNNEVIIIVENNMLDIVDYDGNSLINEKINFENVYYTRVKYEGGEAALPDNMDMCTISYDNNIITVYISDNIKYTYNIKKLKESITNSIDKDNKEEIIEDDVIYFYADGEELLWYDSFYSLNTKEEYDKKYQYLGKYDCKTEHCGVFNGTFSDIKYNPKDKYVYIYDGKVDYVYNYIDNKIKEFYDGIYYLGQDNDKYILAQKDNRVALLDMKGNLLSDYYDDIADFLSQHATPKILQNYSFKHKIVAYKNNNKYGILSLENGQKVTKAIYDDISIYKDNIIVTKDNLEYVVNERGTVISKGYSKIVGFNNDVIIIVENDMLDIIDYDDNSLINEKIDTYGYLVVRSILYESTWCQNILIDYSDNDIIINIPEKNADPFSCNVYKYTYNTKTKELKKEKV